MIEPNLEKPVEGMSVASAARGGSVFAGLSLLQRGLPFLLLPAFAAALTPAEFGQIAFLTAIVGFLGALLSFGLEPWVIRTYVQLGSNGRGRERFVNTIGWFASAAPMAGALAAAAIYLLLPSRGGELPSAGVAAIAFAAAAIQTTSLVFTGAILRARQRLAAYAAISLAQGVGAPLLALLAVVFLDFGVLGWFAASFVTGVTALVLGLLLLDHRWTREVSGAVLRAALVFGLPLLPHAIAHWALSLSDRILLTGTRGAQEAGVYNLAYQLAAPIGVILVALRQGSMPMYASAQNDPGLRHELGLLSTIQVHVAALLGLGVALLGPVALGIAFPDSYRPGADVLPWIALGYVLFGLYLVPADSLSLLLGRTRWMWVPTVVAAATNLILNVLFIPTFGMTAAAASTAVAYGVLLAGVMLLRAREEGPRIDYDLRRMGVGLGLCALAATAGLWLAPAWETAEAALTRIAMVVAAIAIVWAYDRAWWRAVGARRAIAR